MQAHDHSIETSRKRAIQKAEIFLVGYIYIYVKWTRKSALSNFYFELERITFLYESTYLFAAALNEETWKERGLILLGSASLMEESSVFIELLLILTHKINQKEYRDILECKIS